jgi:hypothetical protein
MSKHPDKALAAAARDAAAATSHPLSRLEHLRGKRIVTCDMDGTFYDPWGTIGKRAGFSGTKDNTCLREDTIRKVLDACARYDAVPVVLSWRSGLVDVTVNWLRRCNIDSTTHGKPLDNPTMTMQAILVPGSRDDINRHGRKGLPSRTLEQVAFKVASIKALQQHLDCTVVAAFDDNADVINGLADAGVAEAILVDHLVVVQPHEWFAGYLGAPKNKRGNGGPFGDAPSCPPSGSDQQDYYNDTPRWDLTDTPPFDWGDLNEFEDDLPVACIDCDEVFDIMTQRSPDAPEMCDACAASELDVDTVFTVGADVQFSDDWGQQVVGTIQALDDLDTLVIRTADGELEWVSQFETSLL